MQATVECVGHSYAQVAHFYIFERCLDSNKDSCRCKQALPYLATHLPLFCAFFQTMHSAIAIVHALYYSTVYPTEYFRECLVYTDGGQRSMGVKNRKFDAH
jgi:hypothetical protein